MIQKLERKGFFCYNSWLKALEPYSDAERGRILTALLKYSSGAEDGGRPSGNERFILPMLLDQLDRDAEKSEKLCEAQRQRARKRWDAESAAADPGIPAHAEDANNKNQIENQNKNQDKDQNTLPPDPPSGGKRVRFTTPSVAEVDAYCRARGNSVDAEAFVAFYESNGWMIGKAKMKNWQSAVISWEKRQLEGAAQRPAQAPTGRADGRDFDWLTGA